MTTVFDKILDGQLPCHKVYEDEHVLAFLDISPLAPGHTLVIPKERKAFLHELSDEQAAFVAAAAFNDLEEDGRFGYYKDVDEELLTDYEEFENGDEARQVSLAGGDETALGGRSQWTRLECGGDAPNDWDFPLQPESLDDEVTTEIDWMRLFWQYVTAPYSGSDPSSAPGFWDAVELVTESQTSMPWTTTVVWPRMDQAIDAHLGGNDWVERWRELSGSGANGNAVYNDE